MLKVGIIGCGAIAHGKHLKALAKIDKVEMVAFCDIIVKRAEKAAKEFGVEGARVYESYTEMLENEKLDIVHVCTPNSSHAPISIAAMESDCHVMCEKPMAKTYLEAKAMFDSHKKTGKKLTIGYQNRFRPDSTYLKNACGNGDLGEIYYGKALALRRRAVPTWGVFLDEEKQGGGPLIDIGTHALDLTLWCMDNYKPKSVKGNVYRKLGDQTNTGNIFGEWDPTQFTVEDSAFAFITMEDGATIILESSWAINMIDVKEAATTLAGTKAGADMNDGLRINGTNYGKLTTTIPDIGEGGVAFFDGKKSTPTDIEAQQWINAVINDTDPIVLPEQALVVTQILEAIYESGKTGKLIEF